MDTIKNFVYAGLGLATMTTDKIKVTIDDLVEKGKISDTEGKKIIEDFLNTTEEKRTDFENKLKKTNKNYLCVYNMSHRICENIKQIEQEVENVHLVVVSKYRSLPELEEVYACGHRNFGENRVQETLDKYEKLPKDINWHKIGHLQTNKVKTIAPFVTLIHAVDSIKLLKEINKQAVINNRIIDCLLQFHIAEEDTKFGLNLQEAQDMLMGFDYKELKNIRLTGIMGMATFTEDKIQVAREFCQLKTYFELLKSDYFKEHSYFKEVSMGMSGDYLKAVMYGSTFVRIGSKIFGQRY